MACEILINESNCPTMYRAAVSEIAANFAANLTWLDKVYPLAEIGEKPKGNTKIRYPRVHLGANNYADLFPEQKNGESYCFFELSGRPTYDTTEKTLSFPLRVTFWVKYDESCGAESDPTHNLVQQILYLSDQNMSHFVDGTISATVNKEEVWSRYGYTFEELRQVEHPYTTFAIDFNITQQDGIDCFDCVGGVSAETVLVPASGSFILNQSAVVQTPGRFDISGQGRALGFCAQEYLKIETPESMDDSYPSVGVYDPATKRLKFRAFSDFANDIGAGGDYIENQIAANQVADLRISGRGLFGGVPIGGDSGQTLQVDGDTFMGGNLLLDSNTSTFATATIVGLSYPTFIIQKTAGVDAIRFGALAQGGGITNNLGIRTITETINIISNSGDIRLRHYAGSGIEFIVDTSYVRVKDNTGDVFKFGSTHTSTDPWNEVKYKTIIGLIDGTEPQAMLDVRGDIQTANIGATPSEPWLLGTAKAITTEIPTGEYIEVMIGNDIKKLQVVS